MSVIIHSVYDLHNKISVRQTKASEVFTWKARSSSLSCADVNVVRIRLCFRFSDKTPSWPPYIL